MAPLCRAILLAPILLLIACDASNTSPYQPKFSTTPVTAGHEYSFGVHPQRNPAKLYAVFGPLVDYLNTHVKGATFVFEASRSFAAFDEKVDTRHFDFMLPNPYGTVKGIDRGYHVFGKMGNENDLRGLILVRRDSPIAEVADLKGKTVGFPAPTALAATMMTQYFFQLRGLNVAQDITPLYVGSMESSLMSVYLRKVAAGTAYPPAWRNFQKEQPKEAAEMKVLWQTDPLPDNSLMARDDIPAELVKRVAQALLTMQSTPDGRAVLAGMDLSSFKPAVDADYQPVREFIAQYEAVLGRPDAPGKK